MASKTIAAQRLSSTRRCSQPGPAGWLRDKSNVSGGWPRWLTFTFGLPTMTHTLLVMLSSALLAASGFAAGFVPRLAEQLPGEWESFSFASTNFDLFAGATNLILTVSKVEPLEPLIGFVMQTNIQGEP